MPPQIVSSDEEDEIPSKYPDQQERKDGDDNEDEDEDEDGDEDDIELWEVESIEDHLYQGDKLFFRVKWKGFSDEKDKTWEEEGNLKEGASDILDAYFARIGGRPSQTVVKNRGKGRTSSTPTGTPETSTNGKKRRKTETEWVPPTGSWESQIDSIDTVESSEGQLWVYVHWNNGRKTRHPKSKVYQKAPQKMLMFYEKHLVFKEAGAKADGEGDDDADES